MPYCRRCGTQLEEDAHFCHKCGTPFTTFTPPAAPAKPLPPLRKDPYVIGAVALVAILVTVVVIAAVFVAPFSTWGTSSSFSDQTEGVKTLNLNFDTDVGRVTIFTSKIGDSNVGIFIQVNGSRGITGGENPLSVAFVNQTVGDVLTVDAKVAVEDALSGTANVVCQIFVDPALNLNLNVTSSTGQVSFSADKPTTIQSLTLRATTGEVEANLQSNVIIAGNLTLSTTTGEVNYRMAETNVNGNCSLNLHSTTGAVNMDITQTRTFQGNLAVDAETVTGSINLGLVIDSGVGAKITSETNVFGDINTNLNNFSGDKSPIQSNNYPAQSNIEITNRVSGIGSIYIDANYKTQVISS